MDEICICLQDTEKLKSKSQSYYVFNRFGGMIGSGAECCWPLQDRNESLREEHVFLSYEEDCFGISPIKGCEVFFNGSFSPLESDYVVALDIGDTFKIGELEFVVKSAEEVVALAEEASHALGNITDYNKLDTMKVKLKGTVENFETESKSVAEGILTNDEDLLNINPATEHADKLGSQRETFTSYNTRITSDNVFNLLQKITEEIINNSYKGALNISEPMENTGLLTIKDMDYIVENIPLIKTHELNNSIILALIFKELQSPLFNELKDSYVEEVVSSAISRSVKNDSDAMMRLAAIALEKYLKN